jgi:hypothetical protein
MAATKPFSMKQLAELPSPKPQDWIVEGLLCAGQRRPSLLCGLPTVGKSTISNQLAIAVATGTPFLNLNSVKGHVILWKTEDTPTKIYAKLRKAGLPEDCDNIHIICPGESPDAKPDSDEDEETAEETAEEQRGYEAHFDHIRSALKDHPETRLVIIETLMDFLDIEDISKNGDCKNAMKDFRKKLMRKHKNCAFLFLHQNVKSRDDSNLSLKKVMGATVLVSEIDTMIFLETVSDDNPKRTIMANVRESDGKSIKKTFLDFDEKTSTMSLAASVADEAYRIKKEKEDKAEFDFKLKLCQLAKKTPGIYKSKLMQEAKGNSEYANKAIDELLERGELVMKLGGVKGNAQCIYLPEDAHLHDTEQKETQNG